MAITIYEDTLQKNYDGDDKHAEKHFWWAAHGIEVVRTRFDGKHGVPVSFGDYYYEGSNVVVDTKRDLYELMGNLGAGYRRIDHECARAHESGYRLVFLVESGEEYAEPSALATVRSRYCFKCSHGFRKRCNPTNPKSGCAKRGDRKKPFQGYQMAGKMKILSDKYGTVFAFCEPSESARDICDLLGVVLDGCE